MNLLKELFQISEAEVPGDNAVELADLVKNFPNQHKKAIEKLWGGPRLVFHGLPFFGGSNDFYDQLDKAVSGFVSDWSEGDGLEINISSEYEDNSIDVQYTDESDPTKTGQEVYLGYSPKDDLLYVAYDSSLDEDIFNEEWDTAFAEAAGEEYDHSNPEHQKAFDKAFKQYRDLRPFHVFAVTVENGKVEVKTSENHYIVQHNGFYPRGYSELKKQVPDIIDIRLD